MSVYKQNGYIVLLYLIGEHSYSFELSISYELIKFVIINIVKYPVNRIIVINYMFRERKLKKKHIPVYKIL